MTYDIRKEGGKKTEKFRMMEDDRLLIDIIYINIYIYNITIANKNQKQHGSILNRKKGVFPVKALHRQPPLSPTLFK